MQRRRAAAQLTAALESEAAARARALADLNATRASVVGLQRRESALALEVSAGAARAAALDEELASRDEGAAALEARGDRVCAESAATRGELEVSARHGTALLAEAYLPRCGTVSLPRRSARATLRTWRVKRRLRRSARSARRSRRRSRRPRRSTPRR